LRDELELELDLSDPRPRSDDVRTYDS